jgi:type IV secretion system protein VirB10
MSETRASDPQDIRPIVATGTASNWGLYGFLAILALGGFWIFSTMSASREAAQAPSVLVPAEPSAGQINSPLPLSIPSRFLEREAEPKNDSESQAQPAARLEPLPQPSANYTPLTPTPPVLPTPAVKPVSLRPAPPQVVFEAPASGSAAAQDRDNSEDRDRVTADRFKNPSHTIPQGTVIPAVLETALDSTRPGGVRALIQRDVSSFDGSRVLIPRGSRLYGEYGAGIQRGQNRALVQWSRLLRPDGVTIALDSPSSDPLGRAGIKGDVDSKFFQRFGGALLQSVLDIGVGLAVNEATDGVIVALPGSTQNVQITEPQAIQPTLKVKHGTSVSVFVARDLDFSTVDR